MSKQSSRRPIIIPIFLLLLRTFIPIVRGEINSPKWASKGDYDTGYRESFLDTGFNPPSSRGDRVTWPGKDNIDTSIGSAPPHKESIQFLHSFRNGDFHPPPGQQIFYPSDMYYQTEGQQHPYKFSPEAIHNNYSNKLLQQLKQQQQSKRWLQRTGFLTDAPANLPLDYFAQPIQPGLLDYSPVISNGDNYLSVHSPPPSDGTSMKTRRSGHSPHYLIYPNIKRSKDYICHFKLCQVGMSGKRLSM